MGETVAITQIPGLFRKENSRLNKFKRRRMHIANIASKGKSSNLVLVNTTSNNKRMRALIDSAAQCEVITKQAADRLGLNIVNTNTRLVSAQGEKLEVLGEVNFDVTFGLSSYNVTAIVTPCLLNSCDVILGISFLSSNNTMLVTRPGCTPKFSVDGYEIPMIKEETIKGIGVYNINNAAEEGILEYAKVPKTLVLPKRSIGHLKLTIPYNTQLLNSRGYSTH